MSHTYRYETTDGSEAVVIVNSDWSGPAIVRWYDVSGAKLGEVTLPGDVLYAIAKARGKELMVEHMEAFLESLR